MKRYVYIQNGKIKQGPVMLPKSWKHISGFHHLSDPELKKYGWFPWEQSRVELNDNEVYTNSEVRIDEDKVVEIQHKRHKTDDEISYESKVKSDDVKYKRNKLLQETDWIIIKHLESPVTNIDDWKKYRQELRDITLQTTFPDHVEWPIKPEE